MATHYNFAVDLYNATDWRVSSDQPCAWPPSLPKRTGRQHIPLFSRCALIADPEKYRWIPSLHDDADRSPVLPCTPLLGFVELSRCLLYTSRATASEVLNLTRTCFFFFAFDKNLTGTLSATARTAPGTAGESACRQP